MAVMSVPRPDNALVVSAAIWAEPKAVTWAVVSTEASSEVRAIR